MGTEDTAPRLLWKSPLVNKRRIMPLHSAVCQSPAAHSNRYGYQLLGRKRKCWTWTIKTWWKYVQETRLSYLGLLHKGKQSLACVIPAGSVLVCLSLANWTSSPINVVIFLWIPPSGKRRVYFTHVDKRGVCHSASIGCATGSKQTKATHHPHS